MRLKLVALFVLWMLLPVAAQAQGRPTQSEARQKREHSTPPSPQGMPDAVRRAERQTGGQVLNVESMRFQGREIHRVKVLEPGGRIRVIVDDPTRGDSTRPAFRSTRDDDKGNP